MNNPSKEQLEKIKEELPRRWPYDYYECLWQDPETLEPIGPYNGFEPSSAHLTKLTFRKVMIGRHTFKWELVFMPESYRLRGNRVAPIPLSRIRAIATNTAKECGFNKRNKRNLDKVFEPLSELGIALIVVDDNEWLFITKGLCDPSKGTISVPESIYLNACEGERDSLAIMPHELGHLFLGHKALLHHDGDLNACKEEDAEWQADSFAEAILEIMGYEVKQLSLDFYG